MYKFIPGTWTTPAICIFDDTTQLIKYTTTTEVCFLRPGFKVSLKVPNPRAVRLSIVETINNIYLYVGPYYTIAFRRRTKEFDLIGGNIKP